MKKATFSVIVPLYNAEDYLIQCLDSLFMQNYDDYEVIMINDGSTDNSENICKLFCQKSSKFKLFNQKNSGVSVARNRGLKVAKGKYILFVDSDDYVSENMLDKLSKNLNENSLLCFGYTKKYRNREINMSSKDKKITDFKIMYESIFFDNGIGGNIANKVFSKKIIDDYSLCFDSNIHYCEDLLFVFNYLNKCNLLTCMSDSLYFYRMRLSSASFNFVNEKNLTILDAYAQLIDYFSDNQKIKLFFEYNYLLSVRKFNKLIKKYKVRAEIINNEDNIIKEYNPSFFEKFKYKFVYGNKILWNLTKKIKSVFFKLYD